MTKPLCERFKVGDLVRMTPKKDADLPNYNPESEYGVYVGGRKDDIDSEFDYIRVYEFKSGSVWKYDDYWHIELLEDARKEEKINE